MIPIRVGVDLGTSNLRVCLRGQPLVVSEPSVVALDRNAGKILAVGSSALEMLGRTPSHIVSVKPLRDGVIAHYEVTETLLRHYLKQVCRWRVGRPWVTLSVPSGVTSVERRALREAALAAGAARAFLIESPLAAALGAGVDLSTPGGTLVLDVGGGTTDMAVVSLGASVVSESVRVAGDRMDEAIVRHLRKSYNLMVGERTAEALKIELATAWPEEEVRRAEVRGRDLVNGLPRTVTVSSEEMREALEEPLVAIEEALVGLLERTPPELAADLLERGIVLTGGGALLGGLDRLIEHWTGLPVRVAEDPQGCVVWGTDRADLRRL